MLAYVVIAVLVLLAALFGYAATRPDAFRVERGIMIKAAPASVHALIANFHLWGTWSPWEKLDPTMKKTFSGADNGLGAIYAWEGNRKAGSGRMEIIAATPTTITIQLDFFRPFKARNTAEFTLIDKGSATYVAWAMYGPCPYISKLMGIFFSMDKLIGKDFESGLVNLRNALGQRALGPLPKVLPR